MTLKAKEDNMEEIPQTPLNGEATPSAPATDQSAVTEAETSEVATSEQPAEEATGEQPKPSRAQARISELTQERNYWKDLASQSVPSEVPVNEDGEIGVEDIANAVTAKLEAKEAQKRAEIAREAMTADALQATREFPILDQDDSMARRVIAIAQADGISITQAAREYLGNTKQAAQKVADSNLRVGTAAPQAARPVSTGEAPRVDISNLSEAEKEANWGKILEQMSNRE